MQKSTVYRKTIALFVAFFIPKTYYCLLLQQFQIKILHHLSPLLLMKNITTYLL
jgi:hypothetical protein